MTDAERAIWRLLRNRQISGHRFRRQVTIGPYIADFVCLETKLVIEIDGGQHAQQQSHDETRDALIRDQGFRILRFWNNDVLNNPEGVIAVIATALSQAGKSA